MAVVTREELENAALDVATISEVANGTDTPGTVTSRLGTPLQTLAKLISDLANQDIGASAAAQINTRLDTFLAEEGNTIQPDTPFIALGKMWYNPIGLAIDTPTPLTEQNLLDEGFEAFEDAVTNTTTQFEIPTNGIGRRGDKVTIGQGSPYASMMFEARRDPVKWYYVGQAFIPKFEALPTEAVTDRITSFMNDADQFKFELVNQIEHTDNGVYVLRRNNSGVWESVPFYSPLLSRGVTRVYVDSTASNSRESGESWNNAYTDLQAALDSLRDDTILYLNAPESNPFVGEFTVPSYLRNLTIVTNKGSDKQTWFSAEIKSGWVDAGGGLFTQPVASKPAAVTYDFKKDDASGTYTGLDLTTSEIVAAANKYGWDQEDLRAWYGLLEENTSTPSSPGEGEWGYSAGTLYINPNGSPSLSTVNDYAGYVPGGQNALNFDNAYIRICGKTYTKLYVDGIGVYSDTQANVKVEDVFSIYCNSCVQLDINNNSDNEIKNCLANGTEGYGFVVNKISNPYIHSYCENLCVVKYPYLAWHTAAVSATTATGAAFQETGSAGTAHNCVKKLLMIDGYGDVQKNGGGNFDPYADKRGAFIHTDGTLLALITPWDHTSYRNYCYDSHAIGLGASPSDMVYYRNCVFDRRGYGLHTETLNDKNSRDSFFLNCTIYTGHCNSLYTDVDSNDYIVFDNCKIIGGSQTVGDNRGIFECDDIGSSRLFMLECEVSREDGHTGFNSLIRGLDAGVTSGPVYLVDSRLSVYKLPQMIQDFDGTTTYDGLWWRANVNANTKDRFEVA